MARKILDLTGQRFGRLVVTDLAFTKKVGSNKQATRKYWNCICDCGNHAVVSAWNLTGGITKSCGCYAQEVRMKPRAKKPHPPTLRQLHRPVYLKWTMMLKKCYDTTHVSYKFYGGSGITVCERWRNSFENFFQDMGEMPSKDAALIRIDTSKGYSPSNCQWGSRKEALSRRVYKPYRVHKIFIDGKFLSAKEIAEKYNLSIAGVYWHFKKNDLREYLRKKGKS